MKSRLPATLLVAAVLLPPSLASIGASLSGCAGQAPGAATSAASPPPAASTEAGQPGEAERERRARRLLIDARRLRREGRLEAAERTTRRGLEILPDSPELHRLRAELLAELGRDEEALTQARRADVLAPPPPPLPENALDVASGDLLVVLRPPPEDQQSRGRAPADWPGGPVHSALLQRLAVRLPSARVVDRALPEDASVRSVRRWLTQQGTPVAMTLQVERAWCGESIKDGRFGLARLRVGLAARTSEDSAAGPASEVASAQVHSISHVRHDGDSGVSCRVRKTARALEDVLDLDALQTMLARPEPAPGEPQAMTGPANDWRREQIHVLFPELLRRVEERIEAGRRWLATDQLSAAQAAFEEALWIDPEHLDARSFVVEVELALELSRQLSARPAEERRAVTGTGAAGDGWKIADPQLTTAQVRALEAQLQAEQALRADLLATLAILDDEEVAPDAEKLEPLRPATIRDPAAKGPRRARAMLEQQARAAPAEEQPAGLRARVLYAPGGDLLARYYFSGDGKRPLLVEEDTSGDGRLDRWTGYQAGIRRETWEETHGSDWPSVHIVYDPGGRTPVRVELDQSHDGRPDRVFIYRDGGLVSEFRDSSGDGRFDHVLHFDPDGSLARREEDLDADGRIDVRTTYRSGRMVRREIMNPEVVDERP